MYVAHAKIPRNAVHPAVEVLDVPDPLAPDEAADFPIVLSRRRLARLALVSSETTARFMREGVEADPVAWLFAPQAMFAGRCALDAALDLEDCRRAVLMHGLGLDLNADPAVIDRLRGERCGTLASMTVGDHAG